MSATEALKAARDAGVELGIDGDDLVLQAAAPPPASVLELLTRHKAEVLVLLAAIAYESAENKPLASVSLLESPAQLAEGEPGCERPSATRRGRAQELNGVFMHFCVECGRFGPYGYGVSLRAGESGRWYCREHRPQVPLQ